MAKQTVFCTSFCNFGHVVETGRPVDHECHILPTRMLKAERDGNLELALDILAREGKGPIVKGAAQRAGRLKLKKGGMAMDEIAALAKKYGWLPCELEHARSSNESIYFKECIVPLVNGRSIHCPAFPEECDYVRIVQDGYELAYWHVDEWAEAPAEVMGAILGAAAGRKP